jgi:acetylornithine deacetylase/succinyl-diaminopimelate desuccinylase-like protein
MVRNPMQILLSILVLILPGAAAAAAQQKAPPRRGSAVTQQTPSARPATAAPQEQPPAFDLTKLSVEATDWLAGLLRIDTSNPPGNELAAAKYLADILTRENIPAEIFESAPGRGILVARLSSGPVPDPSRALLLLGHLDVVGVQKEKWTVDPFGGATKDGYLYARGAIDDKGPLVANLAVLVALKRAQARLNRDVILLAEADEEEGGEYGIQFALQKYWDKIAAGYAINEEGRVIVKNGKVQFVGIQASEKISVNVDVIATGTSGHASIPRKDNAIVHVAAAIAKIGEYTAPLQLNTVTRSYFEQLSKVQDEETAKWMRALETPDRAEHAARWLSEANPVWNSMLHDTIAPTIFQAGFRSNVVPSEAKAVLNVRLLPGNLIDPLVEKLRALVNDPQVRFQVEPGLRGAAPSSSLDSELFKTIKAVAAKEFPEAVTVTMMSTGATDSAPLRLRSVQAYGLVPFPLTEDDYRRMHADDERIPVESFHKGIEFLYRIVTDFAAAK